MFVRLNKYYLTLLSALMSGVFLSWCMQNKLNLAKAFYLLNPV